MEFLPDVWAVPPRFGPIVAGIRGSCPPIIVDPIHLQYRLEFSNVFESD